MRDKQIRVGEKYVSKAYPKQKSAVVRHVDTLDGEKYITYDRTYVGNYTGTIRSIETIKLFAFLDEFTEKEEFFVVGGEYKSGDLTYYIKEIYTISNPLGANYRKQARAVIINAAGKRWMEMLSGGDFAYVKRVK